MTRQRSTARLTTKCGASTNWTEKTLEFHSLRRTLAMDFEAHDAPLAIAQVVLVQSSGSITFDLYGSALGW